MAAKSQKTEALELHFKYLFEVGVNFKDRVIVIDEDIEEGLFTKVDAAMSELESYSRQAITIRINSFGGDIHTALAIVGRLKRSKCRIVTEGYGAVMSAASFIFASGNHRRISKFAFYMYHEFSYSAEGRHSAIKAEVEETERQWELWASWMATYSKVKDKQFFLTNGRLVDVYWTPETLLELGLADEII